MGDVSAPRVRALTVPAERAWRRALGYALALYIAVLSAEYVSSSAPIPIASPILLLGYIPYYVALLLVGSRWGPLSFRSHYLFGAIIGLGTESFLTKALYGQPEHGEPFGPVVAGFDVWGLVWVVFTYHPLVTTAIPFLLARHYFGLPQPSAMTHRWRSASLAALPVAAGILAAITGQPPEVVVPAFALNAATLTVLIAVFRRSGRPPASRHGRWQWVITLGLALVLALGSLPQRYVPESGALVATVAGLLVLAWAFFRSVRLDAATTPTGLEHRPAFRWWAYLRYLIFFAAALALSYAAALALLPLVYVLLAVFTYGSGAVSCIYLARVVSRMILRSGAASAHAPSPPPG